jgi:hypothetical protein
MDAQTLPMNLLLERTLTPPLGRGRNHRLNLRRHPANGHRTHRVHP